MRRPRGRKGWPSEKNHREAVKGAGLELKKSRLKGLTSPWEEGLVAAFLYSVPFSPVTYFYPLALL